MAHHLGLNTKSLSFLFFLLSSTDSEYSYYNLILKKAGQFLSNLQINLLKFALSIRAYSPAVQMFQQVTVLCDIFGTWLNEMFWLNNVHCYSSVKYMPILFGIKQDKDGVYKVVILMGTNIHVQLYG